MLIHLKICNYCLCICVNTRNDVRLVEGMALALGAYQFSVLNARLVLSNHTIVEMVLTVFVMKRA